MTENIENSTNLANDGGNLTEKFVFDKGTPTYLRMIEMIKNIAKSKIKPLQNQSLQQKHGCNKNEAIEIEDTPEQYPEKKGNQGNNQNEIVFEQQCEPQQLDKTQQNEAEEAEFVQQDEVNEVEQQDQVYQQQQEQQQQENNQLVEEVQAEQEDQQYQEVKPKAKRTAIKNKPEKQEKNVTHTRKSFSKESKPAINKSNLKIKPRHSSRLKLHQIIPKKSSAMSIPKIHSKSKPQSSSKQLKQAQPLLKLINNSKKSKFQDIFEQSRIAINFEVEQLSTKQIQMFNSKSMKKPNQITRPSLNQRKQQKKIDAKPSSQKLKKPFIKWQDISIILPLGVLSIAESKENEERSLKALKKPPQKQKFTPKILISKTKVMQHKAHTKEKLNLGSYTLLELVEQVYTLGFISEQTRNQFAQNSSKALTKDFLSKFQCGKLRKFNFKTIKFTPLDHRRLSQLVVNLYSQKYCLDLSQLPQDESAQFIRSSYGLSPKEYFEIYSQIDKISDIYWWSEIIINHRERIQNMVRGNRNAETEKDGILKAGMKALSNKFDEIPRKRVKFL